MTNEHLLLGPWWGSLESVVLFLFSQSTYLYIFELMILFFLKYNFIYFWLCLVFAADSRLSSNCEEQGLLHSCGAWASHCHSFSCCRILRSVGLQQCGSLALGHRISSCGSWGQLLLGMWDILGSGIEPVSPALAGRFFTTEPPGKPQSIVLKLACESESLVGTLTTGRVVKTQMAGLQH